MSYKHRQHTLQFAMILFCCLFVAVTRSEVSVDSQSCVVPHWSPPPKDSWYKNEQVTVRIDDAWNETDRGFFQQGIEKWNQANNCSGVTFQDFRSIHFTTYGNTAPPDWTLWWQRRSPTGVMFFYATPQILRRLIAVIVPIPANFQNIVSNSYFVYLGTHETGHTLDLGDCLAGNNCQAIAGTCSIMGGESQSPLVNTRGPFPDDNAAVDVVYCPDPCEQSCDFEACGLNCVAPDPCTYPDNGGCPTGYSRLSGRLSCCSPQSPIVIDVSGNGLDLTDAEHGVIFDISGSGTARHFAWTSPGSDDAWLVLDRNHNGTIDDGTELFGNFTPQPATPAGAVSNGFLALAEYDKTVNGGNNDGAITAGDSIFTLLRLWQDVNHNGVSEPSELRTLASLGLTAMDLDYRDSPKVDEYGNSFRYRAKVRDAHGAQIGRWAWDVFLVSAP